MKKGDITEEQEEEEEILNFLWFNFVFILVLNQHRFEKSFIQPKLHFNQ